MLAILYGVWPCAGLWMSEESVGDAGASSLGYFGGCFSPDGRSIVAHGFTGALHLWNREGSNTTEPHAMNAHHCWYPQGIV